jgi:amino acid permease
MKKLKESGMLYVLIGVAVMLVIGLIEFLTNSDGGATGFEILANQTGSEWTRLIFGTLAIGVVVFLYRKFYEKKQDTRQESLISLAVAIMLFAGIAFGKGCTDKANGGVTSGNGRPNKEVKSYEDRQAAEDMLKK